MYKKDKQTYSKINKERNKFRINVNNKKKK